MTNIIIGIIAAIVILIIYNMITALTGKKDYTNTADRERTHATSPEPERTEMPNTEPNIGNLPPEYPYRKHKLLTRSEYAFFDILRRKANEKGLTALTKVRLEDIVETYSTREKNKYRGYIRSRHIDFVLCSRNMDVLVAIELDGSSHGNGTDRNDILKNNILKAAGVPLVRVRVGSTYENAIDEIIRNATIDEIIRNATGKENKAWQNTQTK